jgi:hypothetical protein
MDSKRRITLVLVVAGIAILSLFLLAIALSAVRIEPLTQLPFWLDINQGLGRFELPGGEFLLTIARYMYIAALLLLPVGVIYLIISKEARRQFLKMLLRMLPFMIVLIILLSALSRMTGQKKTEQDPGMAGVATPESLNIQSSSEAPSAPSEKLVTIISIIAAAVVLLILLGIAFWVWRRSSRQESLVRIAEQAQSALDSLEAGGDLRNTIIRCYLAMNKAVAESRGLRRSYSMTPQEFTSFLIGNGIPSDPVRQLTLLFEQVRYGSDDVTPLMERIAIDCLESIVTACGRPVEKAKA